MQIKSGLEDNRADELAHFFDLIKPKIVEYVSRADPQSEKYEADSLGKFHGPEELKKIFSNNQDLETGIKGNDSKLEGFVDLVLKYSVNTWSPGFLDKLYASNNPIGVVSDIVLSALNTNSHVYTVSPVLSVLENDVGRKYAQFFFDDNQDTCGGLTFPGGSWSNITSMQLARATKYPDTKEHGNSNYKFAIYTSDHCHYSVLKGAILIGLGLDNVFKVKVNKEGVLDTQELDRVIQDSKEKGYTPLYINSTAGTTVFGSFDPFEEVAKIARKHGCWFHIDGSWGGNVVFSQQHRKKLQGSRLADSITVNPHKMLGVPTTCSFLLLPHVSNFQGALSLAAPYLFHGRDGDNENFDLADGTMGCGRRPDAFKFYLAWLYYGTEGFALRVDHAYSICKDFVEKISDKPGFSLVVGTKQNLPACLQVCFYYRPEGYTSDSCTPVTRFISRELHKRGKYLVDFSPNPTPNDSQGEFFRVVFNSPILTSDTVDDLIASIVDLGRNFKPQN